MRGPTIRDCRLGIRCARMSSTESPVGHITTVMIKHHDAIVVA